MADQEGVFDLLADDYARAILAHANRKPMSVRELTTALDAHHSTVYRRIERLKHHDLLAEHLHIDPDGHHYAVYATKLQAVTVQLHNDEYDIRVRVREDPVDRMAQMWLEIRGDAP